VDELIKKVTEKAGINPEQAKNAINGVIDFLKAKMPGVGEQVAGMLSGGGGGGAGNVIDSVRGKLGI
jgi:hypothetical protein